MAILAGLFASLFGRLFSRWWAALAALLALAVYTLMVGAGASVVRAADLRSISLILLASQDQPEDWQEVDAMLVLSPVDTLSVPGGWVHVRTDGEKMWVEKGR